MGYELPNFPLSRLARRPGMFSDWVDALRFAVRMTAIGCGTLLLALGLLGLAWIFIVAVFSL